jgi:hypothetical protein
MSEPTRTNTTDQPTDAATHDGYVPFDLDFDLLARDICEYHEAHKMPRLISDMVDAATRHLRDEVPELDERDIAKALMTASVLILRIVDNNPAMNGRVAGNFIASVGQRLWHNAGGSSESAEHPDG